MKRASRLFLVFAFAYLRRQDLSCFCQTRCRERRNCVAPVKRLDPTATGLNDVVLMNWTVGVHAVDGELETNVSKIGTGEPRVLESTEPCSPILPSSVLFIPILSHYMRSHQPILSHDPQLLPARLLRARNCHAPLTAYMIHRTHSTDLRVYSLVSNVKRPIFPQ